MTGQSPTPTAPADWLTTAQVAALHGVSRRAVLFWLENGQLPGQRFGKAWMVRQIDADNFQRRGPGRPSVDAYFT